MSVTDSYFTIKGLHFVFLQNRSKIEFFLLPGVSYPGESVFLQLKFEYLDKNETKYENNFTHSWVAQVGWNYEKNRRSKISLDCPFKDKIQILTSFCGG